MAREADKPPTEVPLESRQRLRLNEMWRVGLVAARAARIIKELESAPARQGDNAERRKRRVEIIRMYAGVGHPRLNQFEIAARLGISRQRVQYVLAQAGLEGRSVRVKPALTPKFLRHFAERMTSYLIVAGYCQCSSCWAVKCSHEVSRRGRYKWKALCKPCYAAQMNEYRRTGHYKPARENR